MRDPAWGAEWGVNRLMDREPSFMSHAPPNVLCVAPTAPCPIVVYSPSLTGVVLIDELDVPPSGFFLDEVVCVAPAGVPRTKIRETAVDGATRPTIAKKPAE